MLLVDVCAWALPSTTTTHTNKAANNRAEGLPIMSDRTLILFLRVKSRCEARDGLTNVPGDLSKDPDPDIPILKQAKAEYAKLQAGYDAHL
jgi:hypothetical protein